MTQSDFNTGEPLAYFLTWTTYGTWLPGDDRGWNRKGEHESLPRNVARFESARGELKEEPFLLSASDHEVVKNTIHKHCGIRNWQLHAVNVRSNHVHVVVAASETKPQTVVSQLKAWATRHLGDAYPNRKRFWTEGASTRWINREADLASAIEYTLEAQDLKGVE
ncbi:transposase [Mariniblastus fucicola]|uniref:Transposase IS200 like protein n=1 Tax=Mariniblastus fucicola TaxID=980251 RepID=A0A5B9PIX2_9BACT|nr:transposase [Mariniblastus fucicola]QEG25190.1 Transposase IS200 like protein [Mariniblastus fucicola]